MGGDRYDRHVGGAVGQALYTPDGDTLKSETIDPDDRPFGAWLYAGFTLDSIRRGARPRSLRSFELDVGTVGPWAAGREVQTWAHRLINDKDVPLGWKNQVAIKGPAISASYSWAWRVGQLTLPSRGDYGLDAALNVNAVAGNVFDYARAGVAVRAGYGLRSLFVTSAPASSPTVRVPHARPQSEVYAFAFLGQRAVLYNVFIDRDPFPGSHDIERKPWVTEWQWGVSVKSVLLGRHLPLRVSWRQVHTTKEFDRQLEDHVYGSFSISLEPYR
jgi:lipid A 3-O-deacylase